MRTTAFLAYEAVCKHGARDGDDNDRDEPANKESREQPLALAFSHVAQAEEHEPEDAGQDGKGQACLEVDLMPDSRIGERRRHAKPKPGIGRRECRQDPGDGDGKTADGDQDRCGPANLHVTGRNARVSRNPFGIAPQPDTRDEDIKHEGSRNVQSHIPRDDAGDGKHVDNPCRCSPATNTNPIFRFTTSQTRSSAMVAGNRAPYRLLRFTLPSISGIPSARKSNASPRLIRRVSISVHLLDGTHVPTL